MHSLNRVSDIDGNTRPRHVQLDEPKQIETGPLGKYSTSLALVTSMFNSLDSRHICNIHFENETVMNFYDKESMNLFEPVLTCIVPLLAIA